MKKFKLFVVEDNKTEVMLLKLAFSGVQYIDAHYFTSGQELIRQLKEKPEIVVVDLILPDIEGLTLIRTIKKENPASKIIVVSAQESVQLIADIQKEGIFNYIVKSENCLRYLRQVVEDVIDTLKTKEPF